MVTIGTCEVQNGRRCFVNQGLVKDEWNGMGTGKSKKTIPTDKA